MKDLFQEYEKERERLEFNRLLSFSSIGNRGDIAGIAVRPLTVQAWIDLRLCGNDIIEGRFSDEGLTAYLKRVSIGYPLRPWKQLKIELLVSRANRKPKLAKKLIDDTYEHFQEAFDELPESLSKGGTHIENTLPAVEGIVAMIDELSARYGQEPRIVLNMPIACAFALQKAARLATIPDYKILDPQSLRQIKSKYLERINHAQG